MKRTPKNIGLIRRLTLLPLLFAPAMAAGGEEAGFNPDPLFTVVTEGVLCYGLRFSPAPFQIWTATLDCWDVSTGKQRDTSRMRLPADQEANDGPVSMDLSADGKAIATSNLWSGVIRVWRVPTQQIDRQILLPRDISSSRAKIATVQFLKQDQVIGTWYPHSRTVFFGETNTEKADKFIQLEARNAPGILSPSGELLALQVPKERQVVLWDIADDKQTHILQHNSNVWSLAFSPDEQQIATGDRESTVRIWRTADGTQLQNMKGHGEGRVFLPTGVHALTYSRCGRFLASGGHDGRVNIWDLQSQKLSSTVSVRQVRTCTSC